MQTRIIWIWKSIILTSLLIIMSACDGDSSDDSGSDDSDAPSTTSTETLLIGTWKDTVTAGDVTYTFNSSGSGSNDINVPGYAVERRPFTWRVSGDSLYFTYAENGYESTPSEIMSINATNMVLSHSNSGTGYYAKVGASPSAPAPSNDPSPSNDSSNDLSPNDCSGTGTLQIFSSSTLAVGGITVLVDGTYAGVLNSYLASIPSGCDLSQAGTITQTLSAGSHTVSASDAAGRTWSPGSIDIFECGCSTYGLQ